MKRIMAIFFLFFLNTFLGFSEAKQPTLLGVPIPQNEAVFVVVKGIFASKEKAEQSRQLIAQVLEKTPPDGLCPSDHLEGFKSGQWVIASVFDSEQKAKWWKKLSDRNPTLPKSYIQKTRVLKESSLPYFPEPVRDGMQRFHTEDEVLQKVRQLTDIQILAQKSKLKFQFVSYPRSEDYSYEVQILESKDGKNWLPYDFILFDVFNLNRMSRYSQRASR